MDDQVFATGLWVEDYIYRDSQLLRAERVPEEGGRRHFHLDHLGSPRLVTSSDHTSSNEMSEHDFAPFGMEINPLWQESVGGFDREDPKRFPGHGLGFARKPLCYDPAVSHRSTFKRISSDLGGPACVLSAESGYWFRQRCWR
jgi:hypothetical protein